MIQAWKDLRFSAKLTLIFFLVLSLTIGVITIRQSYSSFRLLEEKKSGGYGKSGRAGNFELYPDP